MKLLLDTHVWIWAMEEPDRFGPDTVDLLESGKDRVFVSTISTLEIARLIQIGRIELRGTLDEWVGESLVALQSETVEVSHEIAIGSYSLPGHFHREPADRVLVSTARCHGLRLLTADERILAYSFIETHDVRE